METQTPPGKYQKQYKPVSKEKPVSETVIVETTIPTSLHTEARIRAFKDGVSLKELVRRAIKRYVMSTEAKS